MVSASAVTALSASAAAKYIGGMAHFAQVNNPTSNARTRELLGWLPTHAGLLEDLAERHYFDVASQ